MALPIATQFLLPNGFDAEALTATVLATPGYAFLFVCFYFLFTFFGKGNLIYELATSHSAHTKNQTKLPRRSLIERLKKTTLLEASFGIFLLLITLILVLPSGFSLFLFEKIPEMLILIGVIVFLPILIITFFIRQFSLYYFLLSPLTLRSSCERGVALFIRHRSSIFLFGLFSFIIYGIFTFSLNLAMLGGVVLFQKIFGDIVQSLFFFFSGLFFLTWYTVFNQALWFHFFTHIAKPKESTPQESPLVASDQVPESPVP